MRKLILHFYMLAMLLFTANASFAASVETDRPWYLAGEVMKVSITADSAFFAYAELCDTNHLAAGAVIRLDGGKGTGTIQLPADLHSGYYMLSAYTRHDVHVAQRLVPIINPLRKSVDDDIEWVKVDNGELTMQNGKLQEGAADNYPSSIIHYPLTDEVRETECHIIKARVQNVYGGHTFRASDIHPSISIIGKQIHYFEGKMINDTIALFFTYGIRGKLPLVLSAVTSSGESLPVEIISPFATLIPKQLPHLVFHYKRSEVEARSMEMQRHQAALRHGDRSHDPGLGQDSVSATRYDDTLFDTKPDISYNLDEYRQFLTVREVLIEYVVGVRSKKEDGRVQLYVRNRENGYDALWPAMVLIDGMPVFNIERLLNYDARRVHYINVYGSQYTFGNGIHNGILSFVTRSGQLTNYPTEPNMQYLVYEFPE